MGHWAPGWLLLWVLVTTLSARPLSPNSTHQDTGEGQAPSTAGQASPERLPRPEPPVASTACWQAARGSSAVLLGSSRVVALTYQSVSPVAGSLLWFLGTAVTPRGGTWQAPGPLWFDYPDDDRAKILATYRYIGEKPVFFAASEGTGGRDPQTGSTPQSCPQLQATPPGSRPAAPGGGLGGFTPTLSPRWPFCPPPDPLPRVLHHILLGSVLLTLLFLLYQICSTM
ncbi:fertilization-influencing membrane protein [Caretta caretta]|uniref:fertilization-influencing membrane protein n=1 Tax=Caretta caretta TaxID=8467 RepID=UPI003F4C3F04